MQTALHTLRVVDLSESVAGQYCSRMFADYGTDVTLVEPPTGSRLRRQGPFAHGQFGESLLFFHLNLGKRSVTLDYRSDAGRLILRRVLAGADVVIVSGGEVTEEDVGEGCVISQVSGFGSDGPLRGWKGAELVHQALSGMMYHNGERDREPLYGVGHRAAYAAGVATYICALAALHERTKSGHGQRTSVDIVETASSMCYPYMTQYIYNGSLQRRGEQRQPVMELQCADGWICTWINASHWRDACEALGLAHLADDPRFREPRTRMDNWAELVALLQDWARTRKADDVVAVLQGRKVISARSYDVREVHAENAHLRERGYWETVETEDGSRPILGPQFRMSATPRRVSGGPPTIGAHNAELYGALGYGPREMRAFREAGLV
jgi:crotonobetainyl-CoA:carnitine CoA-transferase CaiB-like acyl-CoA transferase